MPRVDVNRDEIRLQEGPRLAQMKLDLHGIEYLIIDEMSMIGRRSLGQVDTLLQKACGNQELLEVQT